PGVHAPGVAGTIERGSSAEPSSMSDFADPKPHEIGRVPVVLLHGIDDDARSLDPMGRYLTASSFLVHLASYSPSNGAVGLDQLAEQLHDFVTHSLLPESLFDLVAFSMGGLVGRYYLQRLGGAARVRRFVSISSPHRGTLTAYLRRNAGARQMRPGSAFL